MDDCILIGDKYYKVGAVIVKGSNAANVYYYPNGTMKDSGLASPVNASGNPAGLSNLTFCFIECKQPDLVISFKGQVVGSWVSTVGGILDRPVGYFDFTPGYIGNKIYYQADINQEVGNIIVSDSDTDGLLEVTIDNSDQPDLKFQYDQYLFIGTLEQLSHIYNWPLYTYQQVVYSPYPSSITFELPF